jgi:GntR family transcriptional regulator
VDVPQINTRGPEPPHRQIAAWLRERIKADAYGDGVPLESESWLVDAFGVARDTARRAIAVLRDEGLVYTVPQRGTYVVKH